MAAWPSGKAEDCKSFIPSSNLGAAFDNFFQTLGRKPYFRCLDPAKCDGEQLGGLGFLLSWF